MKKRKTKKILSLTLALSILSPNFIGIEKVFAVNNAVPTITNASFSNNQVSLQWDTPIPSSDIFKTLTLDNMYVDATYNGYSRFEGAAPYGNGWLYDRYGNVRSLTDPARNSLKLIDGIGYNGTRGFKWSKTLPDNGWWYQRAPEMSEVYPTYNVESSEIGISEWQKMLLDKPVIVRLQAKGSGNLGAGFNPGFIGDSYNYNDITWAETLSQSDYLYRLQNRIPIKINNPSNISDGNVHHVTAARSSTDFAFYLANGYFQRVGTQWYFYPNYFESNWRAGRPEETVSSIKYVTPPVVNQPFNVAHHGPSRMATFYNINSANWNYYSANTNIPNDSISQALKGYYLTYLYGNTWNDLYVDNIQFAYAPLSKVYRDGQLIMNNNYTVEFTDTTAKDYVAPNTPNVSQSISGNNIVLSWPQVADNGNTYNYQVTSINAYGEESISSPIKTIQTISGIKHYEIYVNGQLYGTTVNTSFSLPNNFNVNNIQVRAVDNVGNKSAFSGSINQFKLQSSKVASGVQLDWSYGSETNNSAYKIYRKDNQSTDFQPIQAKETVKVLQIYPYTNNLQNWVSEYGQGKISCDSMPIETFNSNPNVVWNYDVVVFGFWDSNNNKDITQNAVNVLNDFLNSGRGVLFGHDTMYNAGSKYFNQLASRVNVQLAPIGDWSTVTANGSTVSIAKKGLLTKYPYSIGDIGTVLTIPYTHTVGQKALGEKWMVFSNGNSDYNAYLTTWNNAALIQTGHSSGQATPDEQKLVMNTLFYLAQLTNATTWLDKSAIDVDGPTIPVITNIVANGNNATVYFNKSIDNGTTYDYKISTSKNNGEVFSNVSTQTITAGMKNYEIYANDVLVGTTGNNSYTFNVANNNQGFSVKVVAVDNAGNKSNNAYEKNGGIKLTATPNPQENYIKLDWTKPPIDQEYTYRIYQKGPNNTEFESIPAKSGVKVLNIYPDKDYAGNWAVSNTGLSGGQIDLEGKSVPDSGILKTWLLKENIDTVTIDTVALSDFNANPQKYLKKVNGKWNYDSVFYGMWNLWPETVYPNDNAIEYLRTFINQGGGFMTSHHTMGYTGLNKGVNKLANEMGVEIFANQLNTVCPAYGGRDSNGNLYPTVSFELLDGARCDGSTYWPTGNQVEISQKGFLTNYPFNVGIVGSVHNVPLTHGLNIFGKGQVWMKTKNSTNSEGTAFREITVSPSTGAKGTNNFFVHTYNNTAIINSGHSFPSISQSEVRIIANTLYYLSQVTTANTWNDRMGQDITNPTTPTLQANVISGSTSQITFVVNPSTDNGTTYQYYVEGNGLTDGKTYLSDTVVTTITTGIKGYSYVIDNNPDTVPDNIVDTTSTTITKVVDLTKPIYFHIVAVDNAGNKSETLHYKSEDTAPPKATHKINPNTWTNQNVTITVTGSDVGYGVKRIKLPNGTYAGYIANYEVSANGTYTFVIEDYAGNTTNYPVTITNIDKVNPTGSFTINNGGTQTNDRNVSLKINYNDNLSGVYKIAIRENGVTKEYTPTSSPFTTTWTVSPAAGTKVFYVTLYDRAGNTTVLTNSIIYTNLEIQNFILTNVVNPKVFNSSNPFMPKSWIFSPQSMSAGGNISFQLTLSTPVDLPNYTDTVTYKMKLTHTNGYNITLSGNMTKGNGLTYDSKVMIPKNTPEGTKVELLVTATRQTPEFIETVYFPNKSSNTEFAHIGNVTNNINEEIKFNEIQ